MPQYLAVGHTNSPYVTAYTWSAAGFGTKFANPATLPAGNVIDVAFSPLADAIALGLNASPFISIYPWSGSGFGTKFTDPSTLPPSGAGGIAITGDAVVVPHGVSPYVSAYPWSASGFGTKFSDPSTTPTNNGQGANFTSAGNAIAVASIGSPFVDVYAWSGSGFGTKFSDPGTSPSVCYNVAFSLLGDAIATVGNLTPYIHAYPWSGSGFGTKFSNPATALGGFGRDVAFSPSGNAIAAAHDNSPYITAYNWSSAGFGSKFSDPSTLPVGFGNGVAFAPTGDGIAVSHNTSPFISSYPWSSSGFGTKHSNPSTLPTGSPNSVAIGEGSYLSYFGSASTPADGAATTNTADPTAVTPPGMVKGDLVFMIGDARIAGLTLAISQAGGQNWTTHAAQSATTKSVRVFTCTFNGTWSADPSVSFGSTTCNSAYMHVFSPPSTGYTWSVNVAQTSTNDATSPFSALAGHTTTGTNPTVTLQGWHSPDDNTWGTLTGTGWEVTGTAQYRNTSGSDQSGSFAHIVSTTAQTLATPGKSQLTLGADASQMWAITMAAIPPASDVLYSQACL